MAEQPPPHRVGVVGASGYSGAELLRLLEAHPGMTAAVAAADSNAGQPVAELAPNLPDAGRLVAVDVDTLAEQDLVFLATPDEVSLRIGAALHAQGTPVVDLSGAFRLDPEGFERWYGRAHPHPELAPAVYGLTEFARLEVAAARLVANPGCYVTTALLALLPLAGMLQPGSVVIDGKSGTSGAGRGLADALHASHVHGNVTAYGAPGHRHTGEIERWLTALAPGRVDLGPVTFTPHLVPMARGLLVTATGRLADGVTQEDVSRAVGERYDGEPFVHVLAPGRFPDTKAVAGSNACHLGAVVDERTGRVVVVAVTDNLGKGAAGQAVQNANLMLGCAETDGLTAAGVYP